MCLSRFKTNIIVFIISVIVLIISFFTDGFIFLEKRNEYIGYYVFEKIIYLCLVFMLFYWLFLAIEARKRNGFEWKWLVFASLYMFVFLLFIYCLYPAVEFDGDMPYFIQASKEYRLNGGLHWISTLLYVIGYMAFPIEGGPTIIMSILSSIGYGYVLAKAYFLGINKKWLCLMFLPPYIIYGLYPTRMTMMTLVFIVYFTYLYSNYLCETELTIGKMVIFLIFTGMLSVWRMEGKYLLVFAPLFLMLAFRKKITMKRVLLYFVLVSATYLIFGIPDRFRKPISLSDRLIPVVGYMLPLMEMNGTNWKECSQYNNLNSYIDMDNLTEREKEFGIELYRADYLDALGNIFRNEDSTISKEEYAWSATKACLEYPLCYLKTRLKTFFYALNGRKFPFVGNTTHSILRRRALFLLNGSRPTYSNFHEKGFVHKFLLLVIECAKDIIWQLWITFFSMIFIVAFTLKRKEFFLLMYSLGLLIFAAVVFLFCPACSFKYYWPIYSYCILFFVFRIGRTWKNKNQTYEEL